ncbi:Transcriptional adapter 1 [Halotydeus destructor]|nr:Transcriptional adapter 1 [Halotydeus destructor]
MNDLTTAKKELFDSLGDLFKSYLNLMKLWFKGTLTKEGFDLEATKFMKPDQIKLHNKFLLSLFLKCHSLSGAVKKDDAKADVKPKSIKPKAKKFKATKIGYDQKFIPMNHADFVGSQAKPITNPEFQSKIVNVSFAPNEGSLPDHFNAHLRIFVSTWETGLDGVTDEAVRLVNLSIRSFVKNVLTSVLSYKSSCQTKDSGRFKYGIGSEAINPYLKNSLQDKYDATETTTFSTDNGDLEADLCPTVDIAEQQAMFRVACSSQRTLENMTLEPVSLWHLYHALKFYKNCIPSHTVYATSMERITTLLCHDGDLESKQAH